MWQERLLQGPLPAEGSPVEGILAYLAWQASTWPRLASANQALPHVRTRTLRVDGHAVKVQWNPARSGSTLARVDEKTIQDRPCFLCPVNLPVEERCLPATSDLMLLSNPAPVLPDHLVLPHREHRPQCLLPVLGQTLEFAERVSGRFTVLYNAIGAGASAPDHLHLQAVASGFLPDEESHGKSPPRTLVDHPHLAVAIDTGGGRARLVFQGQRVALERALRGAITTLAACSDSIREPPFNLLIYGRDTHLVAILYLRGAHRPACFFDPGPTGCQVSPGAVDVGGVVVTVREQDFLGLDAERIRDIFEETSPDRRHLGDLERWILRELR